MEKFKPSADQLAMAKKVAGKHKVSAIYMNKSGELFLQENLAQLSVKSKDDYTLISITADGQPSVPEFIDHEITEEDLAHNPFMRGHYKAGDIVQLPKPTSNLPIEAPVVEGEDEDGNTGDQATTPAGETTGDVAGEENNPPEDNAGGKLPPLPFDVTELSEKQVKAELPAVTDKAIVARILEAEEANGKRKGVMAALNDRIAELDK